MLANLSRIEARVQEIQGRLADLEPQPAEASAGFSQVLAEAGGGSAAGGLPPASVGAPSGAAPFAEPASLPPPPHWSEEDPGDEARAAAAVIDAAGRHGVDPALAAAVARAESGFNPRAVSAAGAQGLMQLMPGTARALGVEDPFDAEQNAEGGVRYLAQQLQRFGDVQKALAAYNAGPTRVERYGGVPPIQETESYVRRVLEYQRQFRVNGLP